MYKSGFISIIGRPNVGKSTLLNHILKTKLVITSPTAQTTRNTVQGIYTDEEAQMIFLDTPGIHKPQDGLGSFMNATALGSIAGTDIILLMEAADERIGKGVADLLPYHQPHGRKADAGVQQCLFVAQWQVHDFFFLFL